MPKPVNRIGHKYTRLLVIAKADGKDMWLCKCDCGVEKIANGRWLKSGDIRSCGCLKIELTIKRQTKYPIGTTTTKEYKAWSLIKDRCYNPKNEYWDDYGGRGIKMCDRWRYSFSNFFEDMGFAPTPKHTIDRFPDNDGNYELGNCRWATQKQQSLNRRNNKIIEYNGVKKCLSEWCELFGVSWSNTNTFIKKYGVERVFDAYSKPRPLKGRIKF